MNSKSRFHSDLSLHYSSFFSTIIYESFFLIYVFRNFHCLEFLKLESLFPFFLFTILSDRFPLPPTPFIPRFQIQRSSILKGTLIINKRVTTSNKISRATINYQRNGRIYYNKATLKPDVSPRSSSLAFATTCVYA